jgi:hypothetical protein
MQEGESKKCIGLRAHGFACPIETHARNTLHGFRWENQTKGPILEPQRFMSMQGKNETTKKMREQRQTTREMRRKTSSNGFEQEIRHENWKAIGSGRRKFGVPKDLQTKEM